MGAPRRTSSRLQEIPEEKRPYYGSDRKRSRDKEDDTVSPKQAKLNTPRKRCSLRQPRSEDDGDQSEHSGGGEEIIVANDEQPVVTGALVVDDNGVSFVTRVKETLRTFNRYYLQFVKDEEQRCKKPEEPQPGDTLSKRPSKRPDLKAIQKMKKDKKFLNPKRLIGHIPGIKVGSQFFSRSEMVAVGLHGHWLSGIDYIGETQGKKEKDIGKYSLPLALAIVLSGQYEDDVDKSEEIVYTGQGGHDLLGNKRQIQDQVMSRGNLALKNSMEHSTPVRVIRGHRCITSYTRKAYTYDGLYKVVDYWAEKGVAGFTVFKYRLKRLPDQPDLVTNEVSFVRGKGPKAQSEIPGLVCKDISGGLETIPVPVTNLIDDSTIAQEGFTYITSVEIASKIKIPPSALGCNCKGTCTDPDICSCAKRNRSDFPYVSQDGGRLIEPMDVVFECGPNCGCGPGCVNRTSQRGLKYRLEVYRTFDKGWAVRSWDYIPSGAPVCEYIGVLRRSDDLDNVTGNEFIFEIDCWQTINEIGGRERRLGDVSLAVDHAVKKTGKTLDSAPEFCLDAGSRGNVTRFINHSCDPNLFVQCVLSSHHDLTLARIVLFAADNIAPLQELTYDYGYELDSVVGSNGKIKKLPCYCGAACCRKRLY